LKNNPPSIKEPVSLYIVLWCNRHNAHCRNYAQYLTHTRVNRGDVPLSWKVLLSGYVPQYLYERAAIDTSLPLQEFEAPISHQRCRTGG